MNTKGGYQIIEINATSISDGSIEITDNSIKKYLWDIVKGQKHLLKPILFKLKNGCSLIRTIIGINEDSFETDGLISLNCEDYSFNSVSYTISLALNFSQNEDEEYDINLLDSVFLGITEL